MKKGFSEVAEADGAGKRRYLMRWLSKVMPFAAIGLGDTVSPCVSPSVSPTKKDGASPLRPVAPSSGVGWCLISALDALLKPIHHFLLDPADPALAELNPFGKRSNLFQTGYVLRGVENEILELTLRQYPHRNISS